MVAWCCQAELPPEKQKWFQGRSAHFYFVTDGSEKETLELARSFEILQEILKIISPDLQKSRIQVRQQLPSYIYLFSSANGFKSYCEKPGIDGFFVIHMDGYYIAMESSTSQSTEIAYHEYLHQFLAGNFPGVPAWLNEGLACFFQTMRIDGNEIVLGGPPNHYLPTLYTNGIMSVSRILAVSQQSPEYSDEPERSKFYASAWLLTDYLMTGGDEKRAELGKYLDLIRSGRSLEESYQRAFGRASEALDKELKDYLRLLNSRKSISTWIVSFKNLVADPSFSFSELPRPEALGRLGLLLISNNRAFQERSREHFKAALALDPKSFSGNLGMGILALMENKHTDAVPNFEQASLGHPDDAIVHFFAGMTHYLRSVSPKNATDQASEEGVRADLFTARAHLVRALELGCPNPDVLPMLTTLVLMNEQPVSEDFALLEKACQLLPGQFELKRNLAILYERASKRDMARMLLHQVAEQNVDPKLATLANSQLKAMDFQEADRIYRSGMEAFKQKHYEEAVTTMETAIRLSPEPFQRKGFQENLEQMKILIDLRTKIPARPARKGKT
ncbi:MAG: hypothetical protein IPN59_16090 [Holophaga sp.]|nr:hypothetical protein [Holophaga sp.]